MSKLTVYSKPNCSQCVTLKNLLDSKGIEYNVIELNFGQTTSNPIIEVAEFKKQNPTVSSMPFFELIEDDGSKTSGGFTVAMSKFR